MGASQTKSEVLNEVLNETAISVMTQNSTASSGYINQSNTLTVASNVGGTVSDISQVNSATINVSALQSSAASGNLQSSMTAALTNAIAQESSALGYSASTSNIETIVRNKVSTSITSQNLVSIKNKVAQSNALQILANTNTDVSAITQKNEATLIMQLVSNMNSDIVNSLQTSGTISTDLSQSTSSLFGSFGLMYLVIIAAVVAGIFIFKDTSGGIISTIFKPIPLVVISGSIIVAVILLK